MSDPYAEHTTVSLPRCRHCGNRSDVKREVGKEWRRANFCTECGTLLVYPDESIGTAVDRVVAEYTDERIPYTLTSPVGQAIWRACVATFPHAPTAPHEFGRMLDTTDGEDEEGDDDV